MPVLERLITPLQGTTIFEVTQRCNNDCLYCYNVWKGEQSYPRGEMSTADAKGVISKIRRECPSRYIAFSGGEPLMRSDIIDLVSHASTHGLIPTLITNGTFLDDARVKGLIHAGTRLFELTLLASEKSLHNRLCRNSSFDAALDALVRIKEHKGRVAVVFVATRWNIGYLEETLKLCLAMGVNSLMLNRLNPGGEALRHMDDLFPSLEEVHSALEIADRFAREYDFSISCGIAMQPCLIDTGKFRYISFGYCSAGTNRSYHTIDSIGNLRICNHTPTILGSFLKESYAGLTSRRVIAPFVKAIPEFCTPCPMRFTCQGGCKAAAQVCYGSIYHEEPFLNKNLKHSQYGRPSMHCL